MNSRLRTNSAQSLPTISASVPRPLGKPGGRQVTHSSSASSVPLSYRTNYQPPRAENQPGQCQTEHDSLRALILFIYFVTVTLGAGLLAFWYSRFWVPHLSQLYSNNTYGLEGLNKTDAEQFII